MDVRSPSELDALDWMFLLSALGLACLHLYLGLFAPLVSGDRAIQFVIVGVALLVGPLVFFTPYWQPLLYLLGAAFALYLGGLWLFGGLEYFRFGVLAGIIATPLVLLGVYLFVRHESRSAHTE